MRDRRTRGAYEPARRRDAPRFRGARRRDSDRHFGLGTMLGLTAFAAVFAGGLVLARQSGEEPAVLPATAQGLYSAAADGRAGPWSAPAPLPEIVTTAPAAPASIAESRSVRFELCGGDARTTCVVDGDTFWLDGTKIRIADVDTPEVSEPGCASEKALGDRATLRLLDLLNAGPFELHAVGDRDEDGYGRKLRVVTRGEHSLGDQLVAEGLARTWTGRREPWC